MPYSSGQQALPGRQGDGWLVASRRGDTARIHLVRPGHRPVEGVHRSFDDPAVLELRRMADGAVLQSFAFGPKITMDNWSITTEHEQTARFETDRRLVFQLTTRRGAVLVRCRLSGRCQRASGWADDISTPRERFMW